MRKMILTLAAVLLTACGRGGPINPEAKDYQISVCQDFSAERYTVKSATLIVTPVLAADTQATISNMEPVATSGEPGLYYNNEIMIKWQQAGEDIRLIITGCLWDGAQETSGCLLGEMFSDQYVQTVDKQVTVRATFTTAKGQSIHVEGMLDIESTKGVVNLAATTCQVSCVTISEGSHSFDDGVRHAGRKCTYSCDNQSSGFVYSQCGDNACTLEESLLADNTWHASVARDVNCEVVSSDFTALPPLIVPLQAPK